MTTRRQFLAGAGAVAITAALPPTMGRPLWRAMPWTGTGAIDLDFVAGTYRVAGRLVPINALLSMNGRIDHRGLLVGGSNLLLPTT